MERKNIALLAGGYTGEAVISMKSAATVLKHVDAKLYRLFLIVVEQQHWLYETAEGQKLEVDKNDFSISLAEGKIKFDAAFIMIHGSPGEDGKMQGYLDMMQVPYNTCDAVCSAITMNKAYTKSLIAGIENVYVAKSVQLFRNQQNPEALIKASLRLPLFVKPNSGGSSIGMSKVNSWEELSEALRKAFAEDEQIIVEEFIAGREFTMGVYREGSSLRALPSTEIVSSKEFFDYEAKYTTGITEEITPGRMNEEERNRVEAAMLKVYEALHCAGVVRIDYILEEKTSNMYVLEVNTVPGQSENSIIPQQVRSAGMSLEYFYGQQIEYMLSSQS
jgi:D-alanine-D-alanine ligase